MASALKRVGAAILVVVAAALLVGAALLANLIDPGRPGPARSLHFAGYIVLPGHGLLNVLDYLTVAGRSLYVTSESSGDVYRVTLGDQDAPARAAVATFAAPPAAHGVVIDPVSRLGFVTRSSVDSVDVFDPVAMRLVRRIPVANDPDGLFYDPADKLIYAASGDSKLATLIDPAAQKVVATIPLGGAPEFAVWDPDSQMFYQNLKDRDLVVAVSAARRLVVGRWPLAGCHGPTGMALDAPLRRLFIVCSANARLVVFDLDSDQVTAALPIGGGPDSVVFDAGLRRLYATGRSGVMSVIQQQGPDRYQMLDSVRLHYGAHTLAVDPATHAVYAAYASLLVPPRLAVFTYRP